MKKIFTIGIFLIIGFILVGCSSGIEDVKTEIESIGYRLTKRSSESAIYFAGTNEIVQIYNIYDEDDNQSGYIYQFESTDALNRAIEDNEELDFEIEANNIYKNFIILSGKADILDHFERLSNND
jgi:sporulation-control protein spo0M